MILSKMTKVPQSLKFYNFNWPPFSSGSSNSNFQCLFFLFFSNKDVSLAYVIFNFLWGLQDPRATGVRIWKLCYEEIQPLPPNYISCKYVYAFCFECYCFWNFGLYFCIRLFSLFIYLYIFQRLSNNDCSR